VKHGQNLAPLRSAIGMLEDGKFFKTGLIIPYKRDKIPPLRFSIPVFHHSIIPGWKKKNGCLGIPYYQHFVEFPIHLIINRICVLRTILFNAFGEKEKSVQSFRFAWFV